MTDDDERTITRGLYQFAESYRIRETSLVTQLPSVLKFDDPVRFLAGIGLVDCSLRLVHHLRHSEELVRYAIDIDEIDFHPRTLKLSA